MHGSNILKFVIRHLKKIIYSKFSDERTAIVNSCLYGKSIELDSDESRFNAFLMELKRAELAKGYPTQPGSLLNINSSPLFQCKLRILIC